MALAVAALAARVTDRSETPAAAVAALVATARRRSRPQARLASSEAALQRAAPVRKGLSLSPHGEVFKMFAKTIAPQANYWREYNTGDFGSEISLEYKGSLPSAIVMKAAGSLLCKKADGNDGSLTSLPAGYVHTGKTSAILGSQTVGIVVYW
jgi:hypothetical protein